MKKLTVYLTVLLLSVGCVASSAAAIYMDVPAEDVLAPEVEKATQYGLMNGYGNGMFGFRDSMTRAQFATVLGRMLGWFEDETAGHVTKEMQVDPIASGAYWHAIEAAAAKDVVERDEAFRPNDAITRGEMAEMLVRALGLRGAAERLEKESLPFTDVVSRKGYIAVAYDIGMTKGTSAVTFSPEATATRAQAAAMLLRIYEKLKGEEDPWIHAYYAISSYSQLKLAEKADAVTLGWSRMTWDGTSANLYTTSKNGNEYYIPNGYVEVVETLEQAGVKTHLGVYMDTGAADMLASEQGRAQAANAILNEVQVRYKTLRRNPYSGVTIDFEGLRAGQRQDFTAFLQVLAEELRKLNQTLYVCVSPVLCDGPYYDGYDYRLIGELADRVILMAYDYDARDLSGFVGTEYYKTAASAPIDQVYLSLRAIMDPETGVRDPDKVVLGCSNKNVAWKTDEKGKLLSSRPVYPDNDTVSRRMKQEGATENWSSAYALPYLLYETEDGDDFFLWYENDRSIRMKLDLARLLGIDSISFWRLGTIPDYSNWNWAF